MLGNNAERLNIWLSLRNKFDYNEMCTVSLEKGAHLFTAVIFASKVGMLMCAKQEFPEKDWSEALLAFAGRYNGQEIYYPPVKAELPVPPPAGVSLRQGCCGGGKVK